MVRKRIAIIFGTRPEAIKMAPVVSAIGHSPSLEPLVIVTGQHREMLDEVLNVFNISPDFDLNVMEPNQTLEDVTAKILIGMTAKLRVLAPDLVLVHGDTTTTFSSALAAFYSGIPVGHVEAGLRTGNIRSPWPEEANRCLVSRLCDIHFAPTALAKDNLVAEGISHSDVFVTGNTVIDALLSASNKLQSLQNSELSNLIEHARSANRRILLVTGHRRENFGEGFLRLCNAITYLSKRNDVEIVYPVHMNPNVSGIVNNKLSGIQNVHLIDPLGYLDFVMLMSAAHLIITDSGGIQEEAPSLGKPVLVTRDSTERPEAIEAGTCQLVGTSEAKIVDSVERLLDEPSYYQKFAGATNPYGDGCAATRIADHVVRYLGV